MDIQLYAVKINRPLSEKENKQFLDMMPPERRERLMRMPKAELRQEPLCAYAVLYMATKALCGWSKLPQMSYNEFGKPAFDGCPNVQFNISHTRHAALVGLHNEPLGVDIEKIRPVSEWTMQKLAGTTSQQEFFQNWVRRESRSKWAGTGVSPMREREDTPPIGERIIYLDTFPGYTACLCTHSDARVREIQKIVIE